MEGVGNVGEESPARWFGKMFPELVEDLIGSGLIEFREAGLNNITPPLNLVKFIGRVFFSRIVSGKYFDKSLANDG